VSEEDAATCRSLYQLSNVRGHVPTGVDLDYFAACPRQLAADPTVVFLGSMDWYANADAVRQFAAEIWPRVIGRMPQARLLVVGRNPPQDLRDLASSGRNIEITGTVADVRPHLRSAHVMVVPLRIGGGTRLKIFEALAAEVPVVSTHVGAEGLALENGRHILLADQPAEFAEAVLQLLGNPDKGRQIAACARTEVAEKNSWRSAAAVLEKHLEQVIDDCSS
jgi:glycosyltransferase involved in cell wall biosynthesis